MPLSTIKNGQKVRLLHIEDAHGLELRSRLFSLGLVPGAKIEVLRNSNHGPFLISVKGSQIMLGNDIVQKISVV
jgi:Fe2+ transport system protein FeoA